MHKIAFIMCVNYPLLYDECLRYIYRLIVPEGYEIEVITIEKANSMAAGYNKAMNSSGAKIKIYMHQDVFILNKYFLVNLLGIFESDSNIGMIGMVGTEELSRDAVMWMGTRCGGTYHNEERPYFDENIAEQMNYRVVEAADGFLLATSKDIKWREDLFDGFDFYDVSQAFEMQKNGYKVVVPKQTVPWCVHDDEKILSLFHYNHYRKIFLKNYADKMQVGNGENEA